MKKILCVILTLVMLFAMAVPAMATDGNVDVNGTIQNTDNTPPTVGVDNTFKVTIPTAASWYVTNVSYPNVSNTITGTGISETGTNTITNNSTTGTAYEVSFVSFTTANAAATAVASSLTLNLTGNLAADGIGSQNLSAGYSTATTYTADLIPGTPWAFGFSGTYTGTLSTTALLPTYVMTLGFALA